MDSSRRRCNQPAVILIGTVALLARSAMCDDRVVLAGGDVLTGTITAETDTIVTLQHAVLGNVVLKRAKVDALIYEHQLGAGDQPDAVANAAPEEQAGADQPQEYPWKWRLELGFNGSDGRTERFDGRFSIVTRRETDRSRTVIDALYRTATSSGDRTLNRFETGILHDWLMPDSPWFTFAKGRFEADEFADYDQRLSGAAGVGYEFIKDDKTTLIGRLGAGASHELGGPRDGDTTPEGLAILDLSHKLTSTATFTATAEYYPDVTSFSEYHAVLTAAIEAKLAENSPLSLKFGVRDDIERYNESTKDDLFEYFGLLVWEF